MRHEHGDKTVEMDDHTYNCSSRGGAEVSQAECVCKVCQKRGPLSFTTAAELKHKNNIVIILVLYTVPYSVNVFLVCSSDSEQLDNFNIKKS